MLLLAFAACAASHARSDESPKLKTKEEKASKSSASGKSPQKNKATAKVKSKLKKSQKSCSNRVKAVPLCNLDMGKTPDVLLPGQVQSCFEKMQNCLKDNFPQTQNIINDAGDAVAFIDNRKVKELKDDGGRYEESNKNTEFIVGTILKDSEFDLDSMIKEADSLYAESVDLNGAGNQSLSDEKYFRSQALYKKAWQKMRQEINACVDAKNFLGGKGKYKNQDASICSLRLNGDLWKHKVLKVWPGCECNGRGSRWVGDVCVQGMTESPIDERVPQVMEKLVDELQTWGANSGLVVTGISLQGCTVTRLAHNTQYDELGITKTSDNWQDGRGEKGWKFNASYVSSHAEGRACDLESVTFKPRACVDPETTTKSKPKDCSERKLELAKETRQGVKTPFSDALLKYNESADGGIPMFKIARGAMSKPGDKNAGLGKGLADYRELDRQLLKFAQSGTLPRGMSQVEFNTLWFGVATRNAAVDAGFIPIDPVAECKHHCDHNHLFLPSDEASWKILSAEECAPAKRDAIAYCVLAETAGLADPEAVDSGKFVKECDAKLNP